MRRLQGQWLFNVYKRGNAGTVHRKMKAATNLAAKIEPKTKVNPEAAVGVVEAGAAPLVLAAVPKVVVVPAEKMLLL